MGRNIYLLLLVLGVFLFPADNPAADTTIGKLTIVQGTVTVKKPGVEKAVAVGEGDSISVGDVLQTGKNSRAQLVFTDDSLLNLSSDIALRVNQYIYEPEKNRRKAIVKVLAGRARFILYRQMSSDSGFYVETDSALVRAGMADFVVTVLPSETEVAVLENSVSIKNASYLIVDEIRLGINQKTSVKKGTPPSMPSIITPQERREYIKNVRF